MKAFYKRRSPLINSILSCWLIVPLAIAIVVVNHSAVSAQSLTNINADIIRLRTRINRLETELRNTNKLRDNRIPFPKTHVPNTNLYHPPVVDGRAIGSSDPLFQRLSTLLIELKEDVQDINERLTAVEAKVKHKE